MASWLDFTNHLGKNNVSPIYTLPESKTEKILLPQLDKDSTKEEYIGPREHGCKSSEQILTNLIQYNLIR